jgi:hypothetical protein
MVTVHEHAHEERTARTFRFTDPPGGRYFDVTTAHASAVYFSNECCALARAGPCASPNVASNAAPSAASSC